jgi:hypothetical protein
MTRRLKPLRSEAHDLTALSPVTASYGGLMRVASAALVLVLMGISSGCSTSPPKIGRHIGGTWAEASAAFDARVKARFPIGSSAGALLVELKSQGFIVSQDQTDASTFSALYDAPGFPCRLFWRVRWSADNAKITAITASYSGVCV